MAVGAMARESANGSDQGGASEGPRGRRDEYRGRNKL